MDARKATHRGDIGSGFMHPATFLCGAESRGVVERLLGGIALILGSTLFFPPSACFKRFSDLEMLVATYDLVLAAPTLFGPRDSSSEYANVNC